MKRVELCEYFVVLGSDVYTDVAESLLISEALANRPANFVLQPESDLDDMINVAASLSRRDRWPYVNRDALLAWNELRSGALGRRDGRPGFPARVVSSDQILSKAVHYLLHHSGVDPALLPRLVNEIAGDVLLPNDGFILEFGIDRPTSPAADLQTAVEWTYEMTDETAGIIVVARDPTVASDLPRDRRVAAMRAVGIHRFRLDAGAAQLAAGSRVP